MPQELTSPMHTEKLGTVLVVDDEPIIRTMLELELKDEYEVFTAENAEAAFFVLESNAIDLIVSDINMPGMKGYELLKLVKERYPHIKTALITAYNTDDYVRMAKANDITNIIPKATPFNFDEFNSVVRSLVTEGIFGLENYLLPQHNILRQYSLVRSEDIGPTEKDIIDVISQFHNPEPYIQILLEELITNAMYHAPVDDAGNEKYVKHSKVTLEESEAVKIVLGNDTEKFGVSVTDTSGKLTKEHVLFHIDRHIHAEGMLDENGRGLHISRLYSDRLIINIKKNVTTEVIFLIYTDKKYKSFKPLYINEV